MLSVVTLDSSAAVAVTLHADTPTSKRCLTSAEGLRGIQSLRDSKRVRPQAHGGINETKYEDGRTVTLVGEIASQVGIEDAFNEFGLIAAPMIQTLDSGPALLKWTEGTTGNQLQRLVKLDGDLDPTFSDAASIISYQAQFFSEDPRAYSQTQTQVSSSALSINSGGLVFSDPFNWLFNPAAGGIATATQAGNRPSPLVFRIHGGASNPWITRLSTGATISLLGTVSAPDYLEIDCQKRTIKLNGLSNAVGFLDSQHTNWAMELPASPTSETYVLGANGFDANAYLDVFYRSAYA